MDQHVGRWSDVPFRAGDAHDGSGRGGCAFDDGIDGNPASLYGVHGGQGGMDVSAVGKNVEPDGDGGYTELQRTHKTVFLGLPNQFVEQGHGCAVDLGIKVDMVALAVDFRFEGNGFLFVVVVGGNGLGRGNRGGSRGSRFAFAFPDQ